MAIRDLQITLTEVGRIRLGERVATAKGGTRPSKIDTFRFTSASEDLVVEISKLYGGTPGPFTGEGVRGKQFQVTTDQNVIPIYLPRQKIDPFYEQWGGQVCTRRCDGERDIIHDQPCDCNPDKRKCKPTTRVNVMLADVTGPGYWRLETHGIYAAMELTQLAQLLQHVDMPLPAKLLLEARQRKFFNRDENKVEVRDWYTPIVILDNVTPRMLANGGEVLREAIQSGQQRAVAAPEAVPAISAAPAGPDPQVIARGLALIASATDEQMPDLQERIAKMGSPEVLTQAWGKRAEMLKQEKARIIAQKQERESAESATVRELEKAWADGETITIVTPQELVAERVAEGEQGPVDTVPPADAAEADAGARLDAEAYEEERKAALMKLLGAAGKAKLNTAAVDARLQEKFSVARVDASVEQLTELAAELAGARP